MMRLKLRRGQRTPRAALSKKIETIFLMRYFIKVSNKAQLAQLVERSTFNRVAVGSNPTLGIFFLSSVGRAHDC